MTDLKMFSKPVVFTDFDECFEQRAQALGELQPKTPVLMVRPDFVRHPEQFGDVTFDMEPTCKIYDIHHGF